MAEKVLITIPLEDLTDDWFRENGLTIAGWDGSVLVLKPRENVVEGEDDGNKVD